MAVPAWQHDISRAGYAAYLRRQALTDRQLAVILREFVGRIGYLINNRLGDPRIGARTRALQYASARVAVEREMVVLWRRMGDTIEGGRRQAGREGINLAMREYDELVRRGNLGGLTRAVSMREAAEAASTNLMSRYLNSVPLSRRVYNNRALSQRWVDRKVNDGILANKSAREIARSVRGLILPNTRGGVSYAAMRLGRTELNNAFHATTIRSTMDQPWVNAYQWQLSASHKHFDQCDDYAEGNHSGLGRGVFSKADVPMKPHPQCLCFLVVVLEKPDKFVDKLTSGGYDEYLFSAATAA